MRCQVQHRRQAEPCQHGWRCKSRAARRKSAAGCGRPHRRRRISPAPSLRVPVIVASSPPRVIFQCYSTYHCAWAPYSTRAATTVALASTPTYMLHQQEHNVNIAARCGLRLRLGTATAMQSCTCNSNPVPVAQRSWPRRRPTAHVRHNSDGRQTTVTRNTVATWVCNSELHSVQAREGHR